LRTSEPAAEILSERGEPKDLFDKMVTLAGVELEAFCGHLSPAAEILSERSESKDLLISW
jgi:hypothetical protein